MNPYLVLALIALAVAALVAAIAYAIRKYPSQVAEAESAIRDPKAALSAAEQKIENVVGIKKP